MTFVRNVLPRQPDWLPYVGDETVTDNGGGAYTVERTANSGGAMIRLNPESLTEGHTYRISGLRLRRNSGSIGTHGIVFGVDFTDATPDDNLANQSVATPVGQWVTLPDFTTDPIPAGSIEYGYLIVRATQAVSSPTDFSFDASNLTLVDAADTGGVTDVLRLEVGLDPAGLTNLIQNGSGEQGGYGWETPVAGSVLVGEVSSWTSYQQGLRFTTAADAGGNYFYTEPEPVVAGEWARAQWHVNYTPYDAYRVRIDWLDSTGALLSSTAWTDFAASYADHSIEAAQAPANTVYARLRFEVGGGGTAGTYPYVYQGSNFSIRDAVLAKAATSGELADLSTTVAIDWYDVLGPTHEIRVSREDLNLGTLTATILDATLDPAVADTIRPGRPVRLTAWNDDTGAFETVFRGLATAAQVKYDTALANAGDSRHARITLEAVDATQALAAANRPEGVATIRDLPYVLEGCGVPWVVNGDSNQVATADVVALNEGASALDQVAITRDSDLGYAWVDRNGTFQAWSILVRPGQNLVPNGDFAANVTGWTAFDATIAWTATGLRLTASGTTPVPFARAYTNPRFEVTPTYTYVLTCESQAVTTARSVSFYVDWWDADGNYLASSSEDYDATTTPNAVGSWTTITVTATAPVGAATAEVTMGVLDANDGEYHDFRNVSMVAQGDVPVLDESVYSDVDVSFDTDACINEVTVKYLLLEAGGTAEVQYGPYVDTASVAEWGRHSSEFTVQGIPQDAASIQAYANLILEANATPGVRVRSMRVPIRDERDLTTAKAFLDLYDLANVAYAAKGINEFSRIVGLTHTITPTGWLLDVSFVRQGSVAAPLVTASPAGRIDPVGSGPASVPVGGVQPYAGSTAPFGWLKCDGAAVSRSTYAALFAVIGTTYGAGNGSTTFNLPDMRNRAPVGVGSQRALASDDALAEGSRTPAHTHNASGLTAADTSLNQSGNTTTGGTANRLTSPVAHSHNVTGNTGSSGGWTGGNSGLPHLTLNFIIKA